MDRIIILAADASIVFGISYLYKRVSKQLQNNQVCILQLITLINFDLKSNLQNATEVNLNYSKSKNSIVKVIEFAWNGFGILYVLKLASKQLQNIQVFI